MELIFKSTGSTTGFSNWLKSFKDIQSSLLIECDLKDQMFVSKGFTGDHTVVKYSKVTFENAGFEVLNIKDSEGNSYTVDEWNNQNTERIKIGIFLILPKFIQVADTFADTEYKLSVNFDVYNTDKGTTELHAQHLNFKSKSLKMKVKACNISEFEYLPDDKFFNTVNVIDKPMLYDISIDAIKNLMSISSVFTSDNKRDIIKFYTKLDDDANKYAIFAYDKSNEAYDYLLGYITEGEGVESEIPVYRTNFFNAVNVKLNDSITIVMSNQTSNKLRLENSDKTSYTVMASVTQA